MTNIKINDNEKKVLTHLVEMVEEDYATYFKNIASHTGLDIKVVRRACRSLARKGLAVFMRGLFDDDGMVAGSGYGSTKAGRRLINPCKSCEGVSEMTTEECIESFITKIFGREIKPEERANINVNL